MNSKYFQSLSYNFSAGGNGDFKPGPNSWVQRLITIVEENIDDPDLTNQWLAAQMNCSEAQFYRLVKQHTDKSPNLLIRDIRLKKAYELIRSKKFKTVKEIASRVGFTRPDYFSRLFKECYGFRPLSRLK